MKVKEALLYLQEALLEVEDPVSARSSALIILAHFLKTSPLNVFLYPEEEIPDEELKKILEKRLTFKPLPYILKEAYFYGRAFYVEEGVLIPRPETETIISAFLETGIQEGPILELGCGSGVISVTLLLECPKLIAFAVDISEKAIEVTRKNAYLHRVYDRLFLIRGNWFTPLKKAPFFKAILSNPPYISLEEWKTLDREVRDFEPKEALLAGPSGREFHESLLENAPFYLQEGGFLIFEMGYNQASTILTLAREYNYEFKFYKDLLNIERCALMWKNRKDT